MDHDYAAAQTQDEPFRRTRGRRRINVLRTQEIPTPPPPPAIDDEDIFGDVEQSDEETQEPADVDSDFTQPPVLDMEATSDNATDNVDPDDQPGPSRHLPLIVPIILPPSYINFGSSLDSTDTSNTASTMSSSASASTITSMDSSSTSTTQTIEIPDSPALATAGDTENSNSTDGDTMEGPEAATEEGTEANAEAVTEANAEEGTDANAEAAPSTPPASTTPGRKRRRVSLSPSTLTPKVKVDANGETEDDEGLTCPICLDSWEMSGDHRLVALRCGHLFGDVCIRRWLNESARQSGLKVCPQCKTKATIKDIRYLYARRLRAVDRSEEHHLREMLDDELKRSQNLMTELATLRMTNALNKNRIEALEQDNERMKRLLRSGISLLGYSADSNPNAQSPQYKLYLERNIDISREPGCRVMIYAKQQRAVIVSQKSSQTLFPGYGVRFVDTQTFRTSRFMHVSLKIVRDLCLSQDQQSLVVTSQEPRSKLFDLRTGKVATQFVPGITPLWSCAMDRNDRENYLYLGGHGNTYVYDIRKPDQVVHEYSVAEDSTPVIQVSAVIPNKLYPNGGFLVCSLRSLYFYEYEATGARPTRLNVEGPFVSMNYSTLTETILISTRCSPNYPQARYIIGSLDKVDDTSVFSVKATFHGSKIVPVMTRPSQIAVEANTLVAGYVQDVKFLSLYDVRRDTRVQSVAVQETVFDTCPIYLPDATYLTALTENKCRIYKVSPVT